jgi:hypothetical protein
MVPLSGQANRSAPPGVNRTNVPLSCMVSQPSQEPASITTIMKQKMDQFSPRTKRNSSLEVPAMV